jgi:hypothetical protein
LQKYIRDKKRQINSKKIKSRGKEEKKSRKK